MGGKRDALKSRSLIVREELQDGAESPIGISANALAREQIRTSRPGEKTEATISQESVPFRIVQDSVAEASNHQTDVEHSNTGTSGTPKVPNAGSPRPKKRPTSHASETSYAELTGYRRNQGPSHKLAVMLPESTLNEISEFRKQAWRHSQVKINTNSLVLDALKLLPESLSETLPGNPRGSKARIFFARVPADVMQRITSLSFSTDPETSYSALINMAVTKWLAQNSPQELN